MGNEPPPRPSTSTGAIPGPLALPCRQPLPRDSLQQLQLDVVVRRADVLDVARPRRHECTISTARAPEAVFTVRTYGDTCSPYEPRISAQISPPRRTKHQVKTSQLPKISDHEPGRVPLACGWSPADAVPCSARLPFSPAVLPSGAGSR
jgi:hypothetical protein